MSIFLNPSTPQQPAFIYATFPAGAAVTDSPVSTAYTVADVLQAEECNGWKPLSITGSHSLVIDYGAAVTVDCLALAGKSLSGVLVEIWGSATADFASPVQILAATALTGSIAAWLRHPTAGYRYFKYIFSNHGSGFMIKHLVPALLVPLPFFNDGVCLSPLQAEGEHLISHAGLFLGSMTNRVMRTFLLDPGQVTTVEKAQFDAWAAACVRTAQGFFFVPDTGQENIYFGWTEKSYKYEPAMKIGLYTIPRIPFLARAV